MAETAVLLHKVEFTKLPSYLYELMSRVLNSHRDTGCYKAINYTTDLIRKSFLNFSFND